MDEVDEFVGSLPYVGFARVRQREQAAEDAALLSRLHRHLDVLFDGHGVEDFEPLERPAEPALREPVRPRRRRARGRRRVAGCR